MNLRPEQRCEATITYKTIREPVYPMRYGGVGLGPDAIEQPGIKEVKIACKHCSIAPVTFQEKGKGPHGAINRARSGARKFIAADCKKFQPFKEKGEFEPTSDFHPNL